MLDILNEEPIEAGDEPFRSIMTKVSAVCAHSINGTPHGKTERGA